VDNDRKQITLKLKVQKWALGQKKVGRHRQNIFKMKKIFLLLLLGISIYSFGQKTENVTGDLYFGFWRYGSFYKQPKKIIKGVESLSTTTQKDTLDETQQNIIRIYEDLKREKLLYAPYIQIILPNDSVVRIYFKKAVYRKIRKNKIDDLQEKNEKVTFNFEVRQIGKDLYYCKKMVSMNRIKGQTLPRQTKFKLEDYN
jgi:hypothetical protein